MEQTEETISLALYDKYRISEWHEKCQILSLDEQIQLIEDFKSGIETRLIALAKLPFPLFVEIYFKQFPSVEEYFKNPAFAYKLYLLDDQTLRFFTERARTPYMDIDDLIKIHGLHQPRSRYQALINEIFYRRLEDMPYANSVAEQSKTLLVKFIHITQYIDLNEAKRLGMTTAKNFEIYRSNGYELESKLNRLNPATRKALEMYLSLKGYSYHNKKDIAKIMEITKETVEQIISYLEPLLLKSLYRYDECLGYTEQDSTEDMIEYTQPKFRDLNVRMETKNIWNLLSDEEKEKLSSYTQKALRLYLTAKYMYRTPASFGRTLVITPRKAQEKMAELKVF